MTDSHGPNRESSSTFRDHKQSPPKGECVFLGNLSLNFLGVFKSSRVVDRPWPTTVNISLIQFLMTWTQISSFYMFVSAIDGNSYTRDFLLLKSLNYLTVLENYLTMLNFFSPIWSFNALLQKFSTNNICKALNNFKDCIFTVH